MMRIIFFTLAIVLGTVFFAAHESAFAETEYERCRRFGGGVAGCAGKPGEPPSSEACSGLPLSSPQTDNECRTSTTKGCPSKRRPYVGWKREGWSAGSPFRCCCGPLPAGTSSGTTRRAISIPCPSGLTCLGNPLGLSVDDANIPILIGRVLRMVFGLIGTIALVIFIYGGALWMTAFGEEAKVKRGWDTMIWGAIGLVVIFGSYVAVDFILKAILGS